MQLEVKKAQERGGSAHRLSTLSNLALVLFKGVLGWLAGAPVLLADAAHSLADVALSAAAWGGYRWSQAPPDDDHHFGHGNGEALASAMMGIALVAAGVGLVVGSLFWEGSQASEVNGALALSAVAVVMAVKVGLAVRVGAVARELNSPSLLAVARDHVSDVWAGLLTLTGVAAAIFEYGAVERLAACAIGLLIARMGFASVRDGFDVLMDRVADKDLRGRIKRGAAEVEGVLAVSEVRVHPLGSDYRVDLEIDVDGELTVREGHEIAHAVADRLTSGPDHVVGAQVHVNPGGD